MRLYTENKSDILDLSDFNYKHLTKHKHKMRIPTLSGWKGLEGHNVTMDNSDVYMVTRKSNYGDKDNKTRFQYETMSIQ